MKTPYALGGIDARHPSGAKRRSYRTMQLVRLKLGPLPVDAPNVAVTDLPTSP